MQRWTQMNEVERVEVYTRWSLYALPWLSLVAVLLRAAADDILPDRGSELAQVVAVAVMTAAVTTRVLRRVMAAYPDSRQVPWSVAWPLPVLALIGAAVLLAGEPAFRSAGAQLITLPIACALGGLRGRREAAAVVAVLTVFAALVAWSWLSAIVVFTSCVIYAFAVRISLWLLGVVNELDQARDTSAQLAVAEERLRFSRDVHDVMGRQLSTIAVQSELAATLAARDDPRAASQMLEVRAVAHHALREVRELARGYRSTDLRSELEGARSLLSAAGIDVALAVDDVPMAWHEPAAWVIREAVTNVLRHSTADRVSLTWRDDVLEIENDGTSAQADQAGEGAGLLGLRERLAPLGADLETWQGETRFALRVRFPTEVST